MVDRDLVLKKRAFVETCVRELRTLARLGEPRTNRELFQLLGEAGWLSPGLTAAMRNLAGFRNVVVPGYETIDLEIVRDIVECRLPDLLEFADAIRRSARGS